MRASIPESSEPQRILVVRNRFIGDTMLAVPFLRNLRRHFPHAVIDVLCESGSDALLADCPYTDELLPWRRPPRVGRVVRGSLGNIVENARGIRERRYDRVYLLKRSLSSALLAWLAGIPWRVGFRSIGSSFLSRTVPVVPHRHQAELFLDLLRCEGIAVDDGRNESWNTTTSVTRADALVAGVAADRPRVFIAPQSTDEHRLWPLDRFARIIDWLVAARGCEVFLCGGPADQPVHDALLRLVDPRSARHVHDHSPAVSLREVGGLLARMDLCLGVDTGLNHIAAANGVPVVVLAGPTDPNRWHPWKTASEIVKAESSRRGMFLPHRTRPDHTLPWNPAPASMQAISIERVMEAVDRLLPGRPSEVPAALPLRVVDLRAGARRYEVWESPLHAAAAAEPATKPLAHAH
ncbi:MAG: glycosyltransferase family 9 protein [Planctomycetia bacterium]